MKKAFIWILVVVSFMALILRFSGTFAEVVLGIKEKSGIFVLSIPEGASVYINGKELGKTPYEDKNTEVKEYLVKIEKDPLRWEGKVKLNGGTVTVINRDLAQGSASSAGEILSLNKGKGITVISNPMAAEVEIDGKSWGKTPVWADIEKGEHMILVSRANYLKRSIKANLPAGYSLTAAVDLALSEADLTNIQTPAITQTPMVTVKSTPTGFLRVRDKPNLKGLEISRVKPGDTLILLSEDGAWYRVRLSDNTEGYVSASYVEKKNP